jgi:hypothetical protein
MNVFHDQSTMNIALVTSWSIHLLGLETLKKHSDDVRVTDRHLELRLAQ